MDYEYKGKLETEVFTKKGESPSVKDWAKLVSSILSIPKRVVFKLNHR